MALANLLQRPVILLASPEDMASLGVGYHGLAGCFLPVRWLQTRETAQPSSATVSARCVILMLSLLSNQYVAATVASLCVGGQELLGQSRPIVLAWASSAHDRYVPLTAIGGTQRMVGFPVPSPMQVDAGIFASLAVEY